MRYALLLLVVAMAGAGCSRSCQELGSPSTVSVLLRKAVELNPEGQVGACLQDRCLPVGRNSDGGEARDPETVEFDMGQNARAGEYTIVVTVDGSSISKRTFDLEPTYPNQKGCPPAVINATFLYDPVTGIGQAQSFDS